MLDLERFLVRFTLYQPLNRYNRLSPAGQTTLSFDPQVSRPYRVVGWVSAWFDLSRTRSSQRVTPGVSRKNSTWKVEDSSAAAQSS